MRMGGTANDANLLPNATSRGEMVNHGPEKKKTPAEL